MRRAFWLIFALFTTPALAFDIGAMTEAERNSFRAEIRAYLLDNPEVLYEAISVLEAREAELAAQAEAQALATQEAEIFNDGHSWAGGNPDGDVTIVEFLDYRCGFCKRAHPVIGELMESDPNIRLIVKELPVLGPESVAASRFALAVKQAHGDDVYKRVHDALMELRAGVNERTLALVAENEGLDPQALFAAMDDPEITTIIEKNLILAESLGIRGTPSFIVGGELIRGFRELDEMEAAVAEARDG